jgi:hypothetical protein
MPLLNAFHQLIMPSDTSTARIPSEQASDQPYSQKNSKPSSGSTAALNVALQILNQRTLKLLVVLMTFTLSVWSMILPRWVRLAITGTFTVCSYILLRFGFRE